MKHLPSPILFLVLVFLTPVSLYAGEDRFPDGTPMPAWFHDASKVPLASLGKVFVLTDYGVVRDSTRIQTQAIQHVIDLAAEQGGVVLVPEGTFRSGALHFRQGSHLWVEGRLKASDRVHDFPLTTTRIEGQTCPYFPALVNIEGVDGFVLGGPGTIDGSGLPFWEEMKIRWKWNKSAANKDGQRPRLVYLSECSNVTLQDLHLKDSPYWTTHSYRSHHLRFLGLTITSPSEGIPGYSTDAIDLDNCHDVLVKDCYMDVCDDGVVLKGGKGTFADKAPENGPNSSILVEDCTFGKTHACLTLGSESVQDRNVILRRSHSLAAKAILHCKLRPDTPQHYAYITVEDITGRADVILKIRPWTQYFHLEPRKNMPVSRCSHINLNRIQVESGKPLDVELSTQYILEDIRWDGKDLFQEWRGPLTAQSTAAPGTPFWTRDQQDAARRKAYAQVNYDEAAVPPYTLEDPLTFADGRKLRSRKEWPARRKEILDIFQKKMYGQLPPPAPIVTEEREEIPAFLGSATLRQVRMRFAPDSTGPHIDWGILTPHHATGPLPTVLLLNYKGNQAFLPECQALLARGYALVTACYKDISPDPDPLEHENGLILQDGFAYSGIFELWGERDPARDDQTGSLMAWAWALMRGLDLIEQESALDASRVLLTGYSRLGKAALVAAAFDERFPVVVVNQSGGGGVPLAKRHFGECIATEVSSFRHWYCRAYDQYAWDTKAMPFDQHLLVSAIAPRAILVEGFNKGWFDTYGEFLSLQAASPVWEFLGQKGLPNVPWPDNYDTSAIGPRVGYVRRDGDHGIAAIDWQWMLHFFESM